MSFNLSNNLLSIINILTFLFSIPIIVVGVLVAKSGVTECGLSSDKYIIAVGALIMIVSLIGLVGSCYRIKCLLWFYLGFLLALIVWGLFVAISTYVVSNKGSGETIPGKGYKEYKLEKYNKLIQMAINDTRNWNGIRTCIVDSKICTGFQNKYANDTVQAFYNERLNAIQAGCCKPPDECGFTYQSPTNWMKRDDVVYDNPDCKAWENDPDVLCFNCKSCKAGVADNMKQSFRVEAIVNVVFLILLSVVSCIGCCAVRNRSQDVPYNI